MTRCLVPDGEVDGLGAVVSDLAAVDVTQSLVDADADLDDLLTDAVELGSDTEGDLDGLVELSGIVSATRDDSVGGEDLGDVDLSSELDADAEVVVFAVDVLRGSAGTVLVVLVLPERGGVVRHLEIGPDLVQGRLQIRDF